LKHRVVIALLFFSVPLAAQQTPPRQLTLDQAKEIASQTNPRIAAARFAAAAAYQVSKEIHSQTMPTVIGSVTGVGADSGSRIAAGGLNNPVLYSRTAGGLAFTDMLTDFGRTKDLIQSADLRAQAQDQLTELSRADVVLATVHSYFAAERAKAVLRVAQQTVDARQLVSDQVTALFNGQLRSQLDVSFANLNLADAKLLFSQATNDSRAAESTLAALLGMPPETTFQLAEETALNPVPDSANDLLKQALLDRPDIKSLRLEQRAAERFADSEHALNHPTVSAIGAAGVAPYAEDKVPSHYGAIGLNMNIPILNGGLFRARQSEADLKAQAADARVKDFTIRVTRDVNVAYLNAKNAFERLNLTEQLLSQAQLSLDLAQGRYDLGLSSIVELSQAQLNLTSAQIANTTARYEYQDLRVQLDYQSGSLP
jgi:outer membrane protein